MQNQILIDIAGKYNKTVAQIALIWAVQNQFIVLPKSKTYKYIIQNIDIFDVKLSEEEMKRIESLNISYHTCWNPNTIMH